MICLEKIAASNVCADISDPVKWQRELRQDRLTESVITPM
ncbi:hypothetical protein PL11201_520114 [Planktothrix sp. PCC 11201]|nr:hypothetical protein PL11201_520114 [Planktothrix sp. PCC 11201]